MWGRPPRLSSERSELSGTQPRLLCHDPTVFLQKIDSFPQRQIPPHADYPVILCGLRVKGFRSPDNKCPDTP